MSDMSSIVTRSQAARQAACQAALMPIKINVRTLMGSEHVVQLPSADASIAQLVMEVSRTIDEPLCVIRLIFNNALLFDPRQQRPGMPTLTTSLSAAGLGDRSIVHMVLAL